MVLKETLLAEYKIIVPDSVLLSRICGTNDTNLHLLETFFNTPVYASGNELSVDTENSDTRQQFDFAVNRILDEMTESNLDVTDEELIQSVLNNGTPCGKDFFARYAISIPGGLKKVFPRTRGQAELIQKMRKSDMIFASGPAGCGKTYIAIAESLCLLLSHKISRIVLTRPVVEAGESLGFLPGDLNEKLDPYIRPLFDSINSLVPRETSKKLIENGIIEIAPLAYMRGRTLSNCAVILDEAQNTTAEQMKMFLTRMGENSKIFVTGDETQIDLPKRISSGFVHAIRLLQNIEGISIARLTSEDIVRNELVKKIIQAYENEEQQ